MEERAELLAAALSADTGPEAPFEAAPDAENAAADAEDAAPSGLMTLTEHLAELRYRLLVCLGFWAAGCCVSYGWAPRMLEAIRALASKEFYFVFTSPTEAFMAFVKMSMTVSFIACLPIFIYHIAAFVCPGLTGRERRWLLRLVPFSFLLFAAGALFAWFIALPVMWKFFLSFQSEDVRALWSIGDAVGFAVGALLLCGIIFQTPLILIFLAALGIVKTKQMAAARRVIYFAALFLAAVVTPTPDAFTACVTALPLIVFFELSILIIKVLRLEPD